MKHIFVCFILSFLCMSLFLSSFGAVYADNQDLETVFLNIACVPEDVFLFEETIAAYESKHPGTKIQIHVMEAEDVRKNLYDQNPSIDVYLVSSNNISQAFLLNNGLILPIASMTLSNDIKTMYPQIQEYVMQGGEFWGYPTYFRASYWAVNEDLLQKFNLGDIPVTLSDYIATMARWYDEKDYQKENVAFSDHHVERFFDQFVIMYLNTLASNGDSITFNTPEFQNILEYMRFLSEHEQQNGANAEQTIFSTEGLPPISYHGMTMQSQYMLPPALTRNDHSCLNAYLDYWVVSSATNLKEEAIGFLECHLETGATVQYLYPYQVGLLEDTLKSEGKSVEPVRIYRLLASHMSFQQGPLIGALCRDPLLWQIATGYLDGSVSLEQTLIDMDQLLQDTIKDIIHIGWKAER